MGWTGVAGLKEYESSNRAIFIVDGSGFSPYVTSSDLAVSLRRHVEKARGKNLIYVYWSYVDTIESMKMEVAVRADRDGVVAEILAKEGAAVKRGQGLVRLS